MKGVKTLMKKCNEFVRLVKDIYKKDFVALHEPIFIGNEKKYLNECIESTFVSSVGAFVDKVGIEFSRFTGSRNFIPTVNGTSALHVALLLAGVQNDTEVITQPLTFVATCNAISHCGAQPVFVDVDIETLGMSPESLKIFLEKHTYDKDGEIYNKHTHKKIRAIVPMHTFGHPCKIDKILEIANDFDIPVVEDAAEGVGSYYRNKHLGTYGKFGTLSFNGNKIITSGGGGGILTDDEELAKRARHITTTAKIPHKWEFYHDETGYNYRMPNINAALLLAQLEKIDIFLENKRKLVELYAKFFEDEEIKFVTEPGNSRSNYWLNAIILENKAQRDKFLECTNANGVMTRPVWVLMNKLPMFKGAFCMPLKNAEYLEERVVNIPSGVVL